MGNSQKLSIVLLLCIQTALALKCRQCTSYVYKTCKHEMKTCIAEDSESCMTSKLWIKPYNAYDPKGGYSTCQKNCTVDDYDYGDYSVSIYCCKTYDYCNDISAPTDDWY